MPLQTNDTICDVIVKKVNVTSVIMNYQKQKMTTCIVTAFPKHRAQLMQRNEGELKLDVLE